MKESDRQNSGPPLVTTISDSNDYMSAELTHYERWHSNAAR